MDFEQVLKDVFWRLVTEGSISYRRIKRVFGLSDDDRIAILGGTAAKPFGIKFDQAS